LESDPYYVALVDGRPVAWFRAKTATMLPVFKEQGRIAPVVASAGDLIASGFGNAEAIPLA
jgi:hypothetical protein